MRAASAYQGNSIVRKWPTFEHSKGVRIRTLGSEPDTARGQRHHSRESWHPTGPQANQVKEIIQGRVIPPISQRCPHSLTQSRLHSPMCPNSDTIIGLLPTAPYPIKPSPTGIKKPAAAGLLHSDRIENIFPMCSRSWFSCSSVITPDLNLNVKPLTSLVMLPA